MESNRKWFNRDNDLEFLRDVIDGNTKWMESEAKELDIDVGEYILNRCENIRWESGLSDDELCALVKEIDT